MEARARSTNSLSFVSENDFELYCFSKCLRSGFLFFSAHDLVITISIFFLSLPSCCTIGFDGVT